MIEQWNVDIDKIKEDLKKDIQELTAHLLECEAQMNDGKNN